MILSYSLADFRFVIHDNLYNAVMVSRRFLSGLHWLADQSHDEDREEVDET